MIELRWLIKKVPRLRGIDDGMFMPPLPDLVDAPSLQYREWIPGCVPGHTEPDWQDIPVVNEWRS